MTPGDKRYTEAYPPRCGSSRTMRAAERKEFYSAATTRISAGRSGRPPPAPEPDSQAIEMEIGDRRRVESQQLAYQDRSNPQQARFPDQIERCHVVLAIGRWMSGRGRFMWRSVRRRAPAEC
jgi:hypothetical protein